MPERDLFTARAARKNDYSIQWVFKCTRIYISPTISHLPLILSGNCWCGSSARRRTLPEGVWKSVCVSVCTLGVSELADEVACLSDSTSEEHSLSSYTSESFDDNGKTRTTHRAMFAFFLCSTVFGFGFFVLIWHRRSWSLGYSKEEKISPQTDSASCLGVHKQEVLESLL